MFAGAVWASAGDTQESEFRQRQENSLSLALLRLNKSVSASSEAGPILQVNPGLKLPRDPLQVAWPRCDHGKPSRGHSVLQAEATDGVMV